MPGRRVSETKPYIYSGLVAEWLRSGLQNRVRVFNSLPDLQYWGIVQQVERQTLNLDVRGSNPCSPATLHS